MALISGLYSLSYVPADADANRGADIETIRMNAAAFFKN